MRDAALVRAVIVVIAAIRCDSSVLPYLGAQEGECNVLTARPPMVPRDHSWSLLNAIDHVPMEAISDALAAYRSMSFADIDPEVRLMPDMFHPYFDTDNGDLASLFDGEAEEWNMVEIDWTGIR